MKGLKKVAICVLIAVFALSAFVGCASEDFSSEYGEELVTNGSFESGTDGWEIVGADGENTEVLVKSHTSGSLEADRFGNNFVVVNNKVRAETYLKQTLRLEKGAVYRLQSNIRIENAITGDAANGFEGAYVGFEENQEFIPIASKKTANTFWGNETSFSYYFTSEFDSVTLTLRLGEKNSGVKGTAFFDGISITKVDAETIGEGKKIYDLKSFVPDNGGVPGILYITIGIIIILALSYGIWVAIRRKGYKNSVVNDTGFWGFVKKYYPLAILLFVALAVKVALGLLYAGNSASIEAYAGGANVITQKGIGTYYATSSQKILPLQVYFMWICGGLINLFSAKGGALYLIIKLPAIICDLVSAVFICKLGKKFIGDRGGLLVSALYLFMPTVLTASSVWGEIDSMVATCAVILFYLILNPYELKNTPRFIGIFVCLLLGAMLKIEFIWLVPVVLAFVVYTFVKKKETRLVIGISAGVGLVLFYLLSIPLSMSYIESGRAFYIFERYFEMLFSGIHYYSKDAFNLYAMVGLNWRSVSRISVIMNLVFAVILFAFVIFVYMKNRSRVELLLISSFTMIGAYTFAIDMSPTVLVVALALMLAYAIVANEKRVYMLFVIYSVIGFLNSAILLNNGGALSSFVLSTAKFVSRDAFLIVMSVVNTLALFGFIYLIYDICINDRIKQIVFIEGDDVVTYWGKITYKFKRK